MGGIAMIDDQKFIKSGDEYDADIDFKEKYLDLPVSKAHSIALNLLERISDSSPEDDYEARQELYDLIDNFTSQDAFSGSASDFHNFACDLAREDEYSLACRIIKAGLEHGFQGNVDLLADYLQFGVSCNLNEECEEYAAVLLSIPKRLWTWRAFSFLIDYYQSQLESNAYQLTDDYIDNSIKKMLSLASDFKKNFPFDEEAFNSEAAIYHRVNMHTQEIKVLKNALSKLEVCPKCAMRYSDILFDQGKFLEAAEVLKRAISDANRTQSTINEGYLYYLNALCKISIKSKANQQYKEDEVTDIYSDFNLAAKGLSNTSYIKVIRAKVNALETKTGIEVPDEFDELRDYLI